MTETYCGKSCIDCTQKEELNCPGCNAGPGRQFGGECELAKCCREKGHHSCDTCNFNKTCNTLQKREELPIHRKRNIEAMQRQKEKIAIRATFLGKWLWILFWLIVPSTIAGIIGHENVLPVAPGLYLTGQILGTICSIAYGVILLKLSSTEDKYRTAGIYAMIAAVINILIVVITGTGETPSWSLILSLPAAILALVGEYNEYNAHAAILIGADNVLSEKWLALWKWYIGCMLAMIGCILLILLFPILGLIVFLGTTIGLVIISIVKLVYLYRTAKVFREYPVES